MSKRIEGITLKIGADTTELNKAIKGIDSELRSTQSQLRDVNRLLKLDPGNTELIAQKQRLLGQAIEETKNKLDSLKEAQAKADEALKNGEINQKQYDALQREIIQTEEELKKLEQQANQSAGALEKISAVGHKMKDAGEKITDVGKKMMPVSVAVGALGVASVKTASDFDSAMSKVQAISGATGSDFDALRDKAREMGEKTVFSASESAEAFQYMAMAGWKTQDMLDGIEGIMNLAAASGEDLATTSDIVTDALTAFGLKASDTGRFVDVLAAASSNSNTNVAMMGETFKYVAPIAGAMGYSIEDTAEAIGLMANAGIKSSQAGTSLRTILNQLNGEIKIHGKALGDVVIQTTNADGSMRDLSDILADTRAAFSQLSESEKAQMAETLVGKNAMSGFLALMNAGEDDVNKLSNAIDNSSGAAANMAETMNDNLGGQLKLLKSALEELAISFGDTLMPVVRKLVEFAQKLVEKFNGLSDKQKKIIVIIGAVVAAIGPLLVVIGTMITMLGNIIIMGPIVMGAMSGLIAPILAVTAVIAGLVAGGILLYKNWDTIKAKAKAIWTGIKNVFGGVADGIGGAVEKIKGFAQGIVEAFAFIPEWWSLMWEGVKNTFTLAMQGIQLVLQTIIGIFQAIPEKWTALWDGIRGVFEGFWTALMENPIVQLFLQLILDEISIFSETLSGLWENIKTIAGTAWELIKLAILGPVGLLISLVTGDFDGLKDGLKKNWEKTKELADQLWGEIKDLITDFAKDILDGVKRTFENLKRNLEGIWNNLKTSASQKWSGIKSAISTACTNAKTAVSTAFESIKTAVSTASEKARSLAVTAFTNLKTGVANSLRGMSTTITGAFRGAIDWLENTARNAWSWGYDLMVNFANGIARGVTWVWDEVWDLVNWIEDMIGFSEPDKGPLSRFHTYGPDMMKLLASGIRDNAYLVKDAIGDVSGLIAGDVSGATSNNYNYGPMSINVYGAEGQDVRELARVIEDRINTRINRQEAVFR